MSGPRCRVYDIDGEQTRIRSEKPLTAQQVGALAEVIEALKAKMQAEREAIGPHEHQWKSPLKSGRLAFCTICKDRREGRV